MWKFSSTSLVVLLILRASDLHPNYIFLTDNVMAVENKLRLSLPDLNLKKSYSACTQCCIEIFLPSCHDDVLAKFSMADNN